MNSSDSGNQEITESARNRSPDSKNILFPEFRKILQELESTSNPALIKNQEVVRKILAEISFESVGDYLLFRPRISPPIKCHPERQLCALLFSDLLNRADSVFDESISKSIPTSDALKNATAGKSLFPNLGLTFTEYQDLIKDIIANSNTYLPDEKEYLLGNQNHPGEIDSLAQEIAITTKSYHNEIPNDHLQAFYNRYLTIGRFFEVGFDILIGSKIRTENPKRYVELSRKSRQQGMESQFGDDLCDAASDQKNHNLNPITSIISTQKNSQIIFSSIANISAIEPQQSYGIIAKYSPSAAQEINRLHKIAVGSDITQTIGTLP